MTTTNSNPDDLANATIPTFDVVDSLGRVRRQLRPIPGDYHMDNTNLDRLEPHPPRKTGHARLLERASFLHYIDRQDEDPALYADFRDLEITAVFDDHHAEFAGWREFTADLRLQRSDAWRAWNDSDQCYWSAQYFTEFLTEWAHTIVEPDALDLIEMVDTFKATTVTTVTNETDDHNGDRETRFSIKTNGEGEGEADPRIRFVINIPVFNGGDHVTLNADFRYRLNTYSEAVEFGFKLDPTNGMVREAFMAEVAAIEEATGLTVMLGYRA